MKSNQFVSNLLSKGFLLAVIIFTLVLLYLSTKAQKVADNWQSVNDQAYFEAKLKTLK